MLTEMMLALAWGQAVPAPKPLPAVYLFADAAGAGTDLLRPALGQDMWHWTTPADYPASGLDKDGKGEVRATVRIDASGAVADCRPEAGQPEALAGLICPIVRQRGKFIHALDRAGRPVSDQLSLRLIFAPREFPPAPYPGDSDGVNAELMRSTANMRITREPDWPRFAPAGFTGKADLAVSVMLYGARDGRFQTVCRVLDRPVDKALSDATCQALATAGYQTRPGESFNRATVLVRWNKGKAKLGLPERIGTPLVFDRKAAQAVPVRPEGATNKGAILLRFPAGGKRPVCQITRTTGSDDGDLAACRHAESLPYTAPVDMFGRKVDGELRLSPVFTQ
ncbi:hypothetical protein P6144_13260 [Sphingomonas sp. HITSZ_GF]|uniref:hypothetical protein n=1 Tax=Sphingomonas sp. HITSZ_GF TaxID=3037247 RepID=UPI00240D9DFC|nr:hypothetical protein [Sphingomonas sp. HITSZ_GF]MDG2534624.1 hypothetical protein [Sphingomonas sp. HITSZ_GF]